MLIWVGDRIINTDLVTDVEITPPHLREYNGGQFKQFTPVAVEVFTTGIASEYDDGGDHPERAHVGVESRSIRLTGESAKKFLSALRGDRPLPPPEAWTGGSS